VHCLAAVESRSRGCTDLRSNPTLRRGPDGRLVEREQKAESHLVAMLCEEKQTTTRQRTSDKPTKTETEKVGVDCRGRFTEGSARNENT
jgi:hypothetical protein